MHYIYTLLSCHSRNLSFTLMTLSSSHILELSLPTTTRLRPAHTARISVPSPYLVPNLPPLSPSPQTHPEKCSHGDCHLLGQLPTESRPLHRTAASTSLTSKHDDFKTHSWSMILCRSYQLIPLLALMEDCTNYLKAKHRYQQLPWGGVSASPSPHGGACGASALWYVSSPSFCITD
jgi:hypothetical protein